jgi:hypothetical protein
MKVLMVGNSTAGSWQMRGVQLGAAIGARVTTTPNARDIAWADLIVLVKRAIVDWGPQLAGQKPIVWDALDFWKQPEQNALDEARAMQLYRQHVARVQPALVIGATQAMAAAIGGDYLPHHSWEGLEPTPAREHVQIVAYQGAPQYLGRWQVWLEEICHARGWSFVVNPPDLRAADILVAFRDGVYDGWICREWKSGVKVVNALAAGRPLITQDSAAWRELDTFGTAIATPRVLASALDVWADVGARSVVVDEARAQAPAFTRSAVAAQYQQLLERVACHA